jgi:hypothetical protein
MTMTNVEQQDARAVAIDAAIVAAIRLHAPEFEARRTLATISRFGLSAY